LIQMPIFLGLFYVLQTAQWEGAGVGALNQTLAHSFANSEIFGAPLRLSISSADGNIAVIIVAAIMVIWMTSTQFITQLQIMSKNQSPEMRESPMYKQQQVLLYILPFIFLFTGIAFPLGVMTYWVVSNTWTMGQQFIVIRNMPTPGSEAALAREARMAKRNARRGITIVEADEPASEEDQPKSTQRAQPVNPKNRKKKKR